MKDTHRAAVCYAVLSYIAWGLLPIYWKLLSAASPAEILTHRIVWSAVFLAILITGRREWHLVRRAFRDRRTALLTAASAVCITGNWVLYIWGVNSGRIVEASLGYFINPLMSIALGRVLLGERLRPLQQISVTLACIGVLYSVAAHGTIPYFALLLAGTFACYGLLRKQSALGPADGLLAETILVAPFALAVMVFQHLYGTPIFLHSDLRHDLMLLLAGVVTSVPLLWFARGAQALPLRTMGVLQYFSPTLQFLVGVLLYSEPMHMERLITFGFIWAGLALYTADAWSISRRLRPLGDRQSSVPTEVPDVVSREALDQHSKRERSSRNGSG